TASLQQAAPPEASGYAGARDDRVPRAGGLFTEADAQRVQEFARKQELPPLPAFQLAGPDSAASITARRFIGVWTSETGLDGIGRYAMLISEAVDPQARATGHYLWGPAPPKSRYQFGKGRYEFAGTIAGDKLTFQGSTYVATASFTDRNRLYFEQRRQDG